MPKQAPASKTALGIDVDETPAAPDVKGFDIRAFAAGTGVVTKSVDVCGKPHLIGRIEELKSLLERPNPNAVEDERAGGMTSERTSELALAQELEELRAEALASIVTWKFRGLRNGEREKILKACSNKKQVEDKEDDLSDELTEFNYRLLATQAVAVAGHKVKIGWEDMRLLHIGNVNDADVPEEEKIEGLGAHFMQTIWRKAREAAAGGGVDVPFSLKSSSLMSPEQ